MSTTIPTGTYTIDPTHSRIGFMARHAMVTKVRGSFNEFEGSGSFDAENPAASQLQLTIEAASIESQSAAHLHAAIDRLPPLQRTILVLYHLDELSIGEIAMITSLAEGTIKSHLFRSRKQLRDALNEHMGVAA